MTTDIRMALENELDSLNESTVESWIERCFEICDPRFDTDWLMGMFELALMNFPDSYEVRSAASRASTMEAQRLHDEGQTREAVARLERLLESDPYCTEAFEMLEKFTQGPSESVEPVVTGEMISPAPVGSPPPAEAIALQVAAPDDLASFLDDDLKIGALPEMESSLEPDFPSLDSEEPTTLVADLESLEFTILEPEVVAPAPPPEPLTLVSEIRPVIQVPAAPPAVPKPPAAVASPPAVPKPPAAVASPPMATSGGRTGFDWRSVVGLPSHSGNSTEPQLEALLPSLTQQFVQAGNYRSLVLLLTDLYQRDSSNSALLQSLNLALKDWTHHLETQSRGQEAGQVAAWSNQLLGTQAPWAQPIMQRYPAQLPNLPDLGSLASMAAPAWMNWVDQLRQNPSRYAEAGEALKGDPQGLQSLFRHLAVQHPEQADHVLNLGWAYSFTGQHALAMVHTQRSLQIQQNPRAFQLLQKIYQDLGQPEMSQRVAQQVSAQSN